ncbi:carbohydrate-binding protein [Streptomyces cavernicola]|uniref:CBM35 domain-containing protein n=1 Tax=Streptomyces cavernicola TaxID=3043613 RepID=A0ABT6SLZ4_9ACTN|nr:CBM35 domain-containing protein [Streptomyces sp. B-S-A6]MDI3409109.1 CBM35 domain-containing protein [Streptomyces sp. B-S-A6]
MTAGNNGASTPEDDDPFGYLYADGQAAGATPPGGGYGYPARSSSFQQVRTVGERQYGQQAQQGAGAGAGAQVPQQNAHYAAPETLPGGQGGQGSRRQPPPGDGRGGRGPNTKGLLIGAIAVVAAVVVGIGAAMLSNSDDDPNSGSDQAGSGQTAGADGGQGEEPKTEPSEDAEKVELPKEDAKALTFTSGLAPAEDVPGAEADGGVYVTGFNTVGAKVTWTFPMKKAGEYKLRVRYGIPGEDADATLVVNGKPNTQPLGMKNFIGSPKGDWEKGWQSTWAPVTLTKGSNVVEIACAEGNKCNANLDRVWLEPAGS